MKKLALLLSVVVLCVPIWAQSLDVPRRTVLDDAGAEPNPWAQTLVEAIRRAAKADIAFLGAAFFSSETIQPGRASLDDLAKGFSFAEDEIATLNLTGAQIRQAIERSLELYPQKWNSFLQLAGATVSFAMDGDKAKISSIRVGRDLLVEDKTYVVATSAPLARGALGYFRIWDKNQITKTLNENCLEALKLYLSDNPRWMAEPAYIKN